jgi:hypothetical protein
MPPTTYRVSLWTSSWKFDFGTFLQDAIFQTEITKMGQNTEEIFPLPIDAFQYILLSLFYTWPLFI